MRADWLKFNPVRFDSATRRLSPEELGVFIRLVVFASADNGVWPQRVCRPLHVETRRWRRIAAKLMEEELIEACGESYKVAFAQPSDWGRRSPTRIERAIVVKRNGGEICAACGATERLSVDHIRPVSKGGQDHYANLQILCRPCNSSKGARA